ncbi:hypothetical protein MEZE111188_12580 [Mesobacillus zeae]
MRGYRLSRSLQETVFLLFGVGSIYSADDAAKAISTGIPLIALARD